MEKAPPECPDKIGFTEADVRFRATLEKDGKVSCLGAPVPVCNSCRLRVPSYTVFVREHGGRSYNRVFRVPVEDVRYNPVSPRIDTKS